MSKIKEDFKVGISICTLGSISILIASLLLISPVNEYSYPSWSTEINGQIYIYHLPIPNYFMSSGFLLILSGIILIYKSKLFPKSKRISYVSDIIFFLGLALMLFSVISALWIFLNNLFIISTPEKMFGAVLNKIN